MKKQILISYLFLLGVQYLMAQVTSSRVIIEKTDDITLNIVDADKGKIKLLNGQVQLGAYTNNTYENLNPSAILTLDDLGNIGMSPTQGILSLWEQKESTLYYDAGDINVNGISIGLGNGAKLTNLVYGLKAGQDNTTGSGNLFMGAYAGQKNTEGKFNTFVGETAGRYNIIGKNNTFLGRSAGRSNTTGSFNTYISSSAGVKNETGVKNTFVGHSAGLNSLGSSNTYISAFAGMKNETGVKNTFIGNSAGYNSSGSNNIFIGYFAGYNETGNNLLYIDNSKTPSPLVWGDFSKNRIVINGNASNNANNRTFFSNGTAGGTTVWNNDSDVRLKENVKTIDSALKKVLKMRGVQYEWKDKREKGNRIGFIAQEVEEVLPEVVEQGDTYSMQYAPITALLVEAIKEQQELIIQLKKEILELKKQ